MPGAGREGEQRGVEVVVRLGEEERRREVFWDVADAEFAGGLCGRHCAGAGGVMEVGRGLGSCG